MSAELHSLNEQWIRAWFDKDAETVDRLMTDDYIYIAPNGLVMDRQAVLKVIRSPGYQLDHGSRTSVVVRTMGQEAAIVRHHWQGSGLFEGTAFEDDHQCVMVCEKRDGEWRVVMEQCSFASQ